LTSDAEAEPRGVSPDLRRRDERRLRRSGASQGADLRL